MKEQFMTWRFWIEIAVALTVCVVVYMASRKYNRSGGGKKKVEYFRVPTSNALIILGLLVPIMVAMASYLYVNNPEGKYSSLLATIVVMFMVLIVAIWETFALLQKGGDQDAITMNFPQDRKYITALGFMYALLLLGLFYFAMFFLFELPAKRTNVTHQASVQATYTLQKPGAKIDQTRAEVLELWGKPASEDHANRTLTYQSERSLIRLTFDESQKLVEINDRRR